MKIQIGTKIKKDGYEGTITKICDGQLKGMVEVRLNSGSACVALSTLEIVTTKFEINKTYETRSICDHNCIFSYTVIKRTAKFMTIKDKFGDIKKVGIKIYEGAESAYPEGNYSMCPVISADRELV